ncbi:tRNA 2-thiouridine(34) synthase MnmA [Candidatus Erwinia haradaeae]|uniref:tRNA-specific 2-thiouridylase MnmA n=1 Tax=Candidatus Erwinia haradaeae TaxID=1922217 RepID=A0A803FUI5_9GAMM|nr:tRNA 2-thiouridine(34) synthase MnmA [Candidatus Erwinia haradaeae]VFP88830.1 tRNA-specific 2-thiouridylase MnmA [Candidatus Erwinia haradaeae]
MSYHKKKVIVGMSGGVDSSVAAFLLKKKGYQVEGLFMKNWEGDNEIEHCEAASDLADAEVVCQQLGIDLHTVNFSAEYWDYVFQPFLDEYKSGYTPNPDILCNQKIKFKIFLEFAIEDLGADYIATGHYVRRRDSSGCVELLRGLDSKKDQSYFLYTLGYKEIVRSLFPLGEFYKFDVRNIALKIGLATAQKKDSTGICFIGKRNFSTFIARYLPEQPGKIISVYGDKLGEHRGLMYYTLGQRKGLRIGGKTFSNKHPWYVVDKDISQNVLVVVQGHDDPHLMSVGIIVRELHWVNNNLLTTKFRCVVKTRYQQEDIPCTLTPLNSDRIVVNFQYPVAAVTPGQSGVFYLNDVCIGGGIIENRLPLLPCYWRNKE